MAANSSRNLGRNKDSNPGAWILGACALVAGLVMAGLTFLFFKLRKKKGAAGPGGGGSPAGPVPPGTPSPNPLATVLGEF